MEDDDHFWPICRLNVATHMGLLLSERGTGQAMDTSISKAVSDLKQHQQHRTAKQAQCSKQYEY